ncbi:hybrid sensor histidine kinase/response regulator [Paraburkholderia mimosarum]|uniref:hybrid sensor histidine kinase/response regulator n=1 Tax=Paraburkholderia mimosarum TaxID=312026 RepID=UPI0004238459|nr:ATP-binding protein [Paraburkholderia mimosarum]
MGEGPSRVGSLVADHLARHRSAILRRWLRKVSRHLRLRQRNRNAAVGLINQLPLLFDELRAVLTGSPAADCITGEALHDARLHARERWRQGFALDELYLELDLLQRCIQASLRAYFASGLSREGQTEIHECVEEFFSAAIRDAIAQFQTQQDRRVNDALRDRDRALAAQQRSEERLRMAADAAGLGIFEWDPTTDTAVWENDRMYEITGQPREHGPLSADAFLSAVESPEEAEHLRTLLADRPSAEVHAAAGFKKIQSGEHCVVEISGRFMPDSSGQRQVLVGILSDITRRAEAENALREADRRKDAFLATLAHELRNPLAPILNAAYLMRHSVGSPSQRSWLQGLIERHAKHLAHLLDDLLDLARVAAGKVRLKKEVFDVRRAVESAIEMTAPAALERGHRLEVHGMTGAPLLVSGDATRIAQVVSNLLDNAVKYTREGGHIQVSVERTPRHVSIAVQDDGMGMDPAIIPSMFEMFEQAPEASQGEKKGLGIGLSVARSLIAMHGGTITASSEGPGRGSRFTIELPLCNGASDLPQEDALREVTAPISRRVLVVDDNHDAAASLALILRGNEVRVAGTGAQALQIAAEFRPEIVFMDLGLPDMSGLDVAAQMANQAGANAPILVALTGYGQPEDRARTRAAGFDHHFVKPAPIEELLRIVENPHGE